VLISSIVKHYYIPAALTLMIISMTFLNVVESPIPARAASNIAAYVPITLTNNQNSATPVPFQQMITFNPSSYSSYEASDFGNIRFCGDTNCSIQLYSWLEGCPTTCSTSSTVADVWVQLTSSIPSSGNQIIYMVFLPTSTSFDGTYWGESPVIASGHNNIAKIFGGNPLAYYPFAEGSGNSINDYSGNGNTGNRVNSPQWLPGNSCVIASCIDFSASSSQYVTLPSDFIPFPASGSSTSPLAFSIWFKTISNGVILGQQDAAPGSNVGTHLPSVYIGTDNKLRVEMFWSGSASPITSGMAFNDGKWHSLLVTYDGAVETAYVDGGSVGSLTMTENIYNSTLYYQIGTGYTNGWPQGNGGLFYFTGTLDDARFFTSSLTSAQITAMIPPNGVMPSISVGALQAATVGVTITSSPSGLANAISIDGSNCALTPCSYALNTGSTHTIAVNTISCGTGCQYAFSSWSDGGAAIHTITASAATKYTGTMTQQYYLTVSGGCNTTGAGWYDGGLTAVASSQGVCNRAGGAGTRISSYSVDGGANAAILTTARFTSSPILMSAAHTVQFNPLSQYQLTLNVPAGAENAVASSSPTIPGDTGWYDSGTTVSFSFTPSVRYNFSSWSGTGGSSYAGSNNPASVVMNSPVSETVNPGSVVPEFPLPVLLAVGSMAAVVALTRLRSKSRL